MHNRVQLSLIIEDNDVYNNLVIPSKHNKDLHPLCIRLLSAYYYNEEVRDLVDGVSNTPDDYEEAENPVMDAITSLRNNLAMQAFLGSDLAQVLENGAEDIADIANGGTIKVSDDNNTDIKVEFTKNTAGNTNVRLLSKNEEVKPSNITTKDTEIKRQEPDALDLVKYLARMLNVDLSGAYKDISDENDYETEVNTTVETVMQNDVSEVRLDSEVKEEVFEEVSSESDTKDEDNSFFEEDFDNSTEDENDEPDSDASNSIKELLGSLSF